MADAAWGEAAERGVRDGFTGWVRPSGVVCSLLGGASTGAGDASSPTAVLADAAPPDRRTSGPAGGEKAPGRTPWEGCTRWTMPWGEVRSLVQGRPGSARVPCWISALGQRELESLDVGQVGLVESPVDPIVLGDFLDGLRVDRDCRSAHHAFAT